jgi:hypothetical protein
MTAPKKSPASVRPNGIHRDTSALPVPPAGLKMENIRSLVAELEVPFSPSLIEWRVMNTSDDGTRGQIAPYADPRAYTDRLNEIFTPAGWTRRYTVTTSPNFERSSDNKLVAKVFVTCDLTIHGIGSHSATGEEWADNNHAGTSAEAQAFKRACSCFGLGRYLYNFTGIWVDIDERQRPFETPQLTGWATPQGWRQGLRPENGAAGSEIAPPEQKPRRRTKDASNPSPERMKLLQKIEAFAEPLGRRLYRGILKSDARVWNPELIRSASVMRKVLTSMQSAENELRRLEEAKACLSTEDLRGILALVKLESWDRLDNLETLQRLVVVLEQKRSEKELTGPHTTDTY